jgi:hypothetical protein
MSDNDVTSAAPAGPPPSRAEFDALARRVNAMDTAARGSVAYSVRSGSSPTALDPVQRDAGPRSGAISLASPLLYMSLPAYVAASLAQAENALLHRDVALQAGDEDIARDCEEQAAGLACIALTRAADELQIPSEVLADQSHGDFLRTGLSAPPNINMSQFREQEIHLLRLVGLSQELAIKHLEASFDAFRESTISIVTVEDVRKGLRAGADAACATQELLMQSRRAAVAIRRRRLRLRRVLVALGGAVIAVANPLAIPLIGPAAVGASVVLGSGAAGAVAGVFED